MDTENMTPEELRALADAKEQETLDKPIKIGYLKHDVYVIYNREHTIDFNDFMLSKQEIENKINDFTEQFYSSLTRVEKGTKMECFLFSGEEHWYDTDGDINEMESDWVFEHIEGIENC